MTLFCFLLLSLFFCGCGVLLFLFTLFAPYNIYSFRKVNTYINNKNRRGFDSERNDSDVNGPMKGISCRNIGSLILLSFLVLKITDQTNVDYFFSFLFLFRSQITVSQKDEHMMT